MDTILISDEFENNNNNIIFQDFIFKDNFSFDVNNYFFENKEECSRYDNTPSSDYIINPKNENENEYKLEFLDDLQSLLKQDKFVEEKIPEKFITSNKSEINNSSTNSNSKKDNETIIRNK